jgi:hypothetical protein
MPRLPSPILNRIAFKRQANRCHSLSTSHKPVLSPLCFHGLTNCFSRKLFALTNICVAPRVSPPNSSSHSGIHVQNESTPLSSYCYELFVVAEKINCIAISNFHTLSQKHPGGGGVCTFAESTKPSSVGGQVGINAWVKPKNETRTITFQLRPQLSSEFAG